MQDFSTDPSNRLLDPAGSISEDDPETALLKESTYRSPMSKKSTVIILCFINLINYMDRFTVAGVLSEIQQEFDIKDDLAGLLQTVFVVAYMIFAPLFGYLGDRYSRKMIMACGITLWCLTTFVGSFLKNFYWFMLFRSLVGIGEASYSTIAPTIISDIFIGNARTTALSVFYFAIPVGSGLGYMVGSGAADVMQNWRWGLRVTPLLGPVAVILMLVMLVEPPRGHAEKSNLKPTSYWNDIKSLSQNASFILSTLAFTCVSFVAGALSWWAPQYIYLGMQIIYGTDYSLSTVSLIFGAICVSSGAGGVALGAFLAGKTAKKWKRAHPIICGVGLMLSAPALIAALMVANKWPVPTFVLVFLAEISMNLNWAIVADITLYVVVPPRRSTAEAIQILVSHLFGDAGSPYLVGLISESIKSSERASGATLTLASEFEALKYALFSTWIIEVIGGLLFLLTAVFIVRDKEKVDAEIAGPEARAVEP